MRDLQTMLATLDVEIREGLWCFVGLEPGDDRTGALAAAAAATVDEREGRTYVVPIELATSLGLPVDFAARWLSLTVHSALDAVGLTAAFSRALADRGVPCNVLAGFHHDHLLIPSDRVDDAVSALRALRESAGEGHGPDGDVDRRSHQG